jgi:CRISPR/Cas system-associated endonuclease Cas3-HD
MILTFEKILEIVPEEIKYLLEKCEQTPQNKTWHPEGPNAKVPHNVLIHTKIVYERARKTGDLNFALAALFHDLGKTEATKLNKKGSWGSYGHEYISAKWVTKYQNWIYNQGGDGNLVYDLVINHMKIKMMDEMRLSKQEEFKKKPNYQKIKEFSEFDNMKTLTPEELSL